MKPFYLFYIVAAALLIAAFPLPYGYYQLLRFACCAAFATATYIAYEHKSHAWPYALGFLAIVFNPFIKIVFNKEVWMVLDVVAGVLLIVWTALQHRIK